MTNAVKHGALRDGAGRVQLNWSVYRDWPDGGARFQLNWLEHLSPAGQAALGPVDLLEGEFPQGGRLGFGSHVLSIAVPRRLNGRADIDFLPEGLSYALDLPLADVAGSGGAPPEAGAGAPEAVPRAAAAPEAVPRDLPPGRSPVDRLPRSA